jgi:pyruvate ferredoxin oxidoreductase gamma subunit
MVFEVRFHGRGGQGAVMAAQALAVAAFHDRYESHAFPFFGAERRGAPVLAFTRFAKERLRAGMAVYEPHFVVVLDESLLTTADVLAGLRPRGKAVVNTARAPEAVQLSRSIPVATVDGTSIALHHTKRPAVNTAMLGAFARATNLISLEGVEVGIREVIGARVGKEVALRNVAAAREAYDRTRTGTSAAGRPFAPAPRWLPAAQDLPPGLATRARVTEAGPVGPGSAVANRTGGWRVTRPTLDAAKCTNCLLCWFYCPDGSIARREKVVELEYDYCKGCGVCAAVCAPGAITMDREPLLEVAA